MGRKNYSIPRSNILLLQVQSHGTNRLQIENMVSHSYLQKLMKFAYMLPVLTYLHIKRGGGGLYSSTLHCSEYIKPKQVAKGSMLLSMTFEDVTLLGDVMEVVFIIIH